MSKVTEYRIVIPQEPQTNEVRAASFIRENIKLVCGKKLAIVKDSHSGSVVSLDDFRLRGLPRSIITYFLEKGKGGWKINCSLADNERNAKC